MQHHRGTARTLMVQFSLMWLSNQTSCFSLPRRVTWSVVTNLQSALTVRSCYLGNGLANSPNYLSVLFPPITGERLASLLPPSLHPVPRRFLRALPTLCLPFPRSLHRPGPTPSRVSACSSHPSFLVGGLYVTCPASSSPDGLT